MSRFYNVISLKKHIIICLTGLIFGSFTMEGQIFRPYMEAGVFGGVGYYLGDINPRRHFYDPGLSAGGMIKHNFTEHHCLRFNAFLGQLKGNDLDFKNEYQKNRAHSFETSLIDFHIGYEFSFMPYLINRYVKAHTPYIFAAIGYSFILSSNTGTTTGHAAADHATIPFGVGYKYRISENISIGCEWGMRKTFTDKIDGILNPGPEGSYARTHNNDWYSFAGVFVTFRLVEKKFVCPGIQEQKTYR